LPSMIFAAMIYPPVALRYCVIKEIYHHFVIKTTVFS